MQFVRIWEVGVSAEKGVANEGFSYLGIIWAMAQPGKNTRRRRRTRHSRRAVTEAFLGCMLYIIIIGQTILITLEYYSLWSTSFVTERSILR